MNNAVETEQRYAFEVFPKRDLCIVRGEGATLWDDAGNAYIDCTAGIGVANVGHTHPAITRAISEQAATLITCPGIFYNDRRAALMEKLISMSPDGLDRAFLCNSGTEAMEAAIKFARLSSGRQGIVSAMRGFHGRTMGALSATFKYRDEFEPAIPGHQFVPYNNLDKLTRVVNSDTAAVILELIQGEGGVRPANPDYIDGVRRLCDDTGTLLIVDEIQTGFARTGRLFASEHYSLRPDIMTLAKAMAGGMPMGATLCSGELASALGRHGSTFGGNPLAAAAALATIAVIEDEGLAPRAEALGNAFAERFRAADLPMVRELRQRGLMIGIELKTKSRPYLEALMAKGVLALPAGPTVIRLLPPLVIAESDLIKACDTLVDVLQQPAP